MLIRIFISFGTFSNWMFCHQLDLLGKKEHIIVIFWNKTSFLLILFTYCKVEFIIS